MLLDGLLHLGLQGLDGFSGQIFLGVIKGEGPFFGGQFGRRQIGGAA